MICLTVTLHRQECYGEKSLWLLMSINYRARQDCSQFYPSTCFRHQPHYILYSIYSNCSKKCITSMRSLQNVFLHQSLGQITGRQASKLLAPDHSDNPCKTNMWVLCLLHRWDIILEVLLCKFCYFQMKSKQALHFSWVKWICFSKCTVKGVNCTSVQFVKSVENSRTCSKQQQKCCYL